MTEKEKCKNGKLYDGNYDESLLKERAICKDKCFEFNNTLPSDAKKRCCNGNIIFCFPD